VLRKEIIDKSQDIARKDNDAKAWKADLDRYKSLYSVALGDKTAAEMKLSALEQEGEAKRKRTEESFLKAKKAKV
jgi:hypothetical protein